MNLKTRFYILFAILILTFSAIGTFTILTLKRIDRLSEIDMAMHQLYILSLELRKNENDFLNRDIKNAEFFINNKSKNSYQFYANSDQVEKTLSAFQDSKFVKRNHLSEDLAQIILLHHGYKQLFNVVLKNKYELGYENWGIIGEMNAAALEIENITNVQKSQTLKINLLRLRQFEKEYLSKRNFTAKSKFDQQLFAIYKLLPREINNTFQRNSIVEALHRYAKTFNDFVDKDLYTGFWKDEGLIALMEEKGNLTNEAIANLDQKNSIKTKKYIAQSKFLLLVLIVVFAALAIFLGIYIFVRIYALLGGEPEVVATISKSISKGDLRIKKADQTKYKGIMKHVLRMTDNLIQMISCIHQNSAQISQATTNFSQTSSTISKVANEQTSYIFEILDRMQRIEENTSRNVSDSKATEDLSKLALNEMKNIKEQAESSFDSSKVIKQKVELINHITIQTKILALNAAVESARAGAYGSGFQVIADEVKRLAEISQETAKEINVITENNLNQSKRTSNLVHEIIPLIEKTTGLIKNIAESSQQQNAEISYVNRNIHSLNTISQENAVIAEEMATSTEVLEKQMLSLNEMIAYFKVEKSVGDGIDFTKIPSKNNNKKKNVRKPWKMKNIKKAG